MAKKFETNQNLINTGFQQLSGQLLSLSGNTLIGSTATLKYASNQHSTYTARSVVDASYVTGLTNCYVLKNIASQGQIIYRNATQLTGSSHMFYCESLSSFIFGQNNCTVSCNTTILGGQNNCICSGNSLSVIVGGQNIVLSASSYGEIVAVPNLAIFCTPSGIGNLLGWDSISKRVCLTTASGGTGGGTITGATNGLHAVGANILLGGELTQCTSLFGNCLDIKGVSGLNIRTTGNTDMNIDAQQAGGFAIKSQFGICPNFNDFTNAIGFFGHVEAPNGFAIYDNRTGTTQTGIVYANDYSSNYIARSLVDKQYVDTVATGLDIHQAVVAATTSGITLSGSPKYIDGVYLTNGMRVLVKDQGIGTTGSPYNGIYIVTGVTWQRASDYNNSHFSGETRTDLIPVTSGLTQNSSIWALVTPSPIIIGVTPLIFTEFSTVIDVVGGDGIAITQVGGVHTVCVQLGTGTASGCGLAVNANGLCVNSSIAGRALSYSTGILNVNVATGGTISSVPVKVNAGNCLVVDCSSINAITGATNGLTRCNNDVWLGGCLITNTCINTNLQCLFITGNTLGASFGLNVNSSEIDIGDYCSTQLRYIHHDIFQTKISHSTTGSTYNSNLYSDRCTASIHQEAAGCIGNIIVCCGYICMNSQLSPQQMCLSLIPTQFSVSSNAFGNHCFCVTTGSTTILHGNGTGSTNNQVYVDHHMICLSQAYTGLTAGNICMDDGTICLSSNILNTSIGNIQLSGNSMTIVGSSGFRGLRYCADNSANFVARSLPDVAYVTGRTSTSGVQTANNGLTKNGTNVRLGGTLTGTTTINGAQNLRINLNDVDITGTTAIDLTSPAVTLQTTPDTGTMNDSMLVWNQTDKKIKIISSTGLTNNIYSKTIIVSSTLLTTGSSYVILVSGTSITITLPSTPTNGLAFKIKDACGNALTDNIIIDSGAGRTIDGSRCAIINTNYGAIEVMFGATCKWFNLSFIN